MLSPRTRSASCRRASFDEPIMFIGRLLLTAAAVVVLVRVQINYMAELEQLPSCVVRTNVRSIGAER